MRPDVSQSLDPVPLIGIDAAAYGVPNPPRPLEIPRSAPKPKQLSLFD
jgi:hypothetical protein